MRTSSAYDMPARRASASEMAYATPSVMAGVRAALVARGSSLRQWAYEWAAANGEAQDASYHSIRMTILRRLDRGLAPMGEVGARLVEALRADLGPDLVPDFAGRGRGLDRAA